jgi:hypothetical protein
MRAVFYSLILAYLLSCYLKMTGQTINDNENTMVSRNLNSARTMTLTQGLHDRVGAAIHLAENVPNQHKRGFPGIFLAFQSCQSLSTSHPSILVSYTNGRQYTLKRERGTQNAHFKRASFSNLPVTAAQLDFAQKSTSIHTLLRTILRRRIRPSGVIRKKIQAPDSHKKAAHLYLVRLQIIVASKKRFFH